MLTSRRNARIGVHAGGIRPIPENVTPAAPPVRASVAEDSVSAQGEARPMRTDLIRRVRREIRLGTYLTADKLDAVVDALADVVRSGRDEELRNSA